MTLLANTVASGALQFRRIDDRSRTRIRKMPFRRDVAPLASDALDRECRGPVLIQRPRDMQRGSRVAENALFADRTREIGIRLIFIAGREIVGLATLVVRDRRLKKMPSEIDKITVGVL